MIDESPKKIIEDLGDGLVMRSAVREDADALAEFCAKVFMDEPLADSSGTGTEAYWIAEWVRDLLTKPHPTLQHSDIIVVEDQSNNRIVSTTTYMTQTFSYDGVEIEIGRPEIVGTASDYRNRGLIRKQFDLMHRWADERGHLVQIIDGIPSYYRQFGYEYAIQNVGGRYALIQSFPSWGDGDERPFHLREPSPDDVPFITRLLQESAERSLVSPVYREEEVRYLTFDRNDRSGVCHRTAILCKADGEPIGVAMYAMVAPIDEGAILRVEMAEPKYWREATKSFFCEITDLAKKAGDADPDPEREIKRIRQDMQPDHPIYIFDDGALGTRPERQYGWYVRVPDIAAFLQKIAPALEARIESSLHARITGDVEIRVDRDRIVISFEDGKITGVENQTAVHRENASGGWVASARFPGQTFLPVLFGMRSVSETVSAHTDVNSGSKSSRHMMETLFPKSSSDLSLTLT